MTKVWRNFIQSVQVIIAASNPQFLLLFFWKG